MISHPSWKKGLLACAFLTTLATGGLRAALTQYRSFDSATVEFGDASLVGDAHSGYSGALFGAGAYYAGNAGFYASSYDGPPTTLGKPWSLSGWYRSDTDTAVTDAIFGWKDSVSAPACVVRFDAGNRVYFEVGTTRYAWRASNTLNRAWHFITITSSATGGAPFNMYVDGVQLTSPSTTTITASPDYATGLIIGSGLNYNALPTSAWDGWMDDVGVWDETLSSSEIAAIHGFGRFGVALDSASAVRRLVNGPVGGTVYLAGQRWERVTGLTGTMGSYGGTLADGSAYVVTSATGDGVRIAGLRATAENLHLSTPSIQGRAGFGGKASFDLQVSNSSATLPLEWHLTGDSAAPSIATVGRQISGAANYLTELLPQRTTYQAALGAYAPDVAPFATGYTEGTRHQVYQNNQVNYLTGSGSGQAVTKITDTSSGASVDYVICGFTGFTSFSGDFHHVTNMDLVTGIQFTSPVVRGDLPTTDLTVRGAAWKMAVMTVPAYQGYTVQHVFLTRAEDGVVVTLSPNAFSDSLNVHNLPDECRLHDLCLISTGAGYDTATLQETARRFLETTSGPAAFVQASQVSSRTPASSTQTVHGVLDATGLAPGTYTTRYAVMANGSPAPEEANTGTATLEVVPPEFTVATPDVLTTVPGASTRGVLTLQPADGATLTNVTASSDAAWLVVTPSENRPGQIDLRYVTTGLAVGSHYIATVTITAGVTTRTVQVDVYIQRQTVSRILADPVRPLVYALNYSQYPFGTATILVMDSTTGATLREIPAGKAYDITLSPDSQTLFAVQQDTNEIVSYDLTAMAKTSLSVSLPDQAGNGLWVDPTAGRNGLLYAAAGPILVIDTKSGTILQKVDLPATATAFRHICLTPDGNTLLATIGNYNYSATGFTQPVYRYAVAADGTLTQLPGTELSQLVPNISTSFISTRLQDLRVSASGRYVAAGSMVYPADKTTLQAVAFPQVVTALSADAEIVVGTTSIFNRDGSQVLATFPRATNYTAVTPEGRVFYFTPNADSLGDRVQMLDIPVLAGSGAVGFVQSPAAAARCGVPRTFRWLPVNGARDYRVYVSKDATALQAAQPPAAALMAKSHTTFTPNSLAMAAGETWYWRVDAVAPAGLVKGAVNTFTVGAIQTDRDRLAVETVKGCTAQTAELQLTSTGGAPVVWTASSSQSWLQVTQSSGSTPATLKLTCNTALTTADITTANLTLTSGGQTTIVPVTLTQVTCSHGPMVSTTLSDYAYEIVSANRLSTNTYPYQDAGPDYLVKIDARSGTLVDSRHVAPRTTSLHCDAQERYLALDTPPISGSTGNNDNPGGKVMIFDLQTFAPVANLISYEGYFSGIQGIGESALGPDGLIFYRNRMLRWTDSTLLGARDAGSFSGQPYFSRFSPDGTKLFGSDYSNLYAVDATSPSLAAINTIARSSSGSPIVSSRDASVMASGNLFFGTDFNPVTLASPIAALSGDGKLAVSGSSLVLAPSLQTLATLPVTTQAAFNDKNSLVISQASGSGLVYSLFSYASLVQVNTGAIVPGIADRSLVGTPSVTLQWTDIPSAVSYRVFFGTDAASVTAAQAGDPMELGVTQDGVWTTPLNLAANANYYWKLIVTSTTGQASTKVFTFHTADFFVDQSAVTLGSPIAGPQVSATISLQTAAGNGWSAASNDAWIKISPASGSGSGAFTITADPAGLAKGVYSGTVSLTRGGTMLSIPVSLNCFAYLTFTSRMDPLESTLYSFVRADQMTNGYYPTYLLKRDVPTGKVFGIIQAGDLSAQGSSQSLFCMPDNDLLLLVNGYAQTLDAFSRTTGSKLWHRTFAQFPQIQGVTSTDPWIVSGGPGKIVAPSYGGGINLYSILDGTLLDHAGPVATYFGNLATSPSADRVYAFTGDATRPIRTYNISGNRFSDGPVAPAASGKYAGVQTFSGDGQTLLSFSTLYNRDLQVIDRTTANTGIISMNRDASLYFQSVSAGYLPASRIDPSKVYPKMSSPLSSSRGYLQDPNGSRMAFPPDDSSPVGYLQVPDASYTALPTVAGAGWANSGTVLWQQSKTDPSAMEFSLNGDPASNLVAPYSDLFFKIPFDGTIAFDWQANTTAQDHFGTYVDNVIKAQKTGAFGWQTVTLNVTAGQTIWISGGRSFGAPYDPSASMKLRNIIVTPSAPVQGAAVVESVSSGNGGDLDGDGFSDLVETALGTDPASAASRPVAGLVQAAASSGAAPAFVFERPVTSAYQFTVQTSDDLGTWQDLPEASIQTTALDAARQRCTAPLPAGKARTFVRLKVAAP